WLLVFADQERVATCGCLPGDGPARVAGPVVAQVVDVVAAAVQSLLGRVAEAGGEGRPFRFGTRIDEQRIRGPGQAPGPGQAQRPGRGQFQPGSGLPSAAQGGDTEPG